MRNTKEQLLIDIAKMFEQSAIEGYSFSRQDAFAIGYMAAKSGLEKIYDNQDKVLAACREYDKDDDLGLHDTIGETLIDLRIIKNDGTI